MNVRAIFSRIGLLAALAALALPASAMAADYYVPPGNSAANQYTETLPSAGGDSTNKGKGVTPAQAIGAKNAKKLESHGPAGKATAELAAETAPVIVEPTPTESSSNGSNGGGGDNAGKQPASQGSGNDAKPHPGAKADVPATITPSAAAVPTESSSGSSGLGSVLGQATGVSDDGSLGLWLPLIIVLTIAGTAVYRLRLRHGPTA